MKLVWSQDHDNIRAFDGVGRGFGFKSVGFDFLIRRAVRTKADNNVNAAIFQVKRMGAALRAIAKNSDFLFLDDREITVFVVIDIER